MVYLLKKLLKIIRKCRFCGKDYHVKERSWRNGDKLELNWYTNNRGKLQMSTHYPTYECCIECNKYWLEHRYDIFKKK
jgi:hypothetical protein